MSARWNSRTDKVFYWVAMIVCTVSIAVSTLTLGVIGWVVWQDAVHHGMCRVEGK